MHGRWILQNAYPESITYRYAVSPDGISTYVTETITLATNQIIYEGGGQGHIIDIGDIATPAVETFLVTIDVNEADGITTCEPDHYDKIRRAIWFFDLQYTGSGDVEIKWNMRKKLFTYMDESYSGDSCIDNSYMTWVAAGTHTEVTINGWSDPETTQIGFQITGDVMIPSAYDLYHIEDGLFEAFTIERPLQHP